MIWLTEIVAADPLTGDWGTWTGPRVHAESQQAAEEYCRKYLGYCRVIGQLVGETILKDKTRLKHYL